MIEFIKERKEKRECTSSKINTKGKRKRKRKRKERVFIEVNAS